MNEDEALDRVVALWKEADELTDEVDRLENEAQIKRDEAAEKQERADALEDEAEAIWRPLIESHPEWMDDFMAGTDPREPGT